MTILVFINKVLYIGRFCEYALKLVLHINTIGISTIVVLLNLIPNWLLHTWQIEGVIELSIKDNFIDILNG